MFPAVIGLRSSDDVWPDFQFCAFFDWISRAKRQPALCRLPAHGRVPEAWKLWLAPPQSPGGGNDCQTAFPDRLIWKCAADDDWWSRGGSNP